MMSLEDISEKECKTCGLVEDIKKECEQCHSVICLECIRLQDDKCVECNYPISSKVSSLSSLLSVSNEEDKREEEEEILIPPPVPKTNTDVFLDSKIRLPNIGNSCYVNSAIQVCLHSKRLWKECCEVIGENYLINFLLAVTTIRKQYAEANKIQIWEQCDSVSILRYIFDRINDLYPKGFNPLYGLCLHSQYKCIDCKTITHQRQFESIYCLFPNAETKSVSDLLFSEFKKTDVEYKCGKCESKKSSRSISLDSIPEYIFISLQHIGDDTNFKIDEMIEMNETEYQIKGCIEHLGMSENGGHYISYFKDSVGEWSLFDDDKIVPVQKDKMKERLVQNKRQYCQMTLIWYSL